VLVVQKCLLLLPDSLDGMMEPIDEKEEQSNLRIESIDQEVSQLALKKGIGSCMHLTTVQ
jgi:hypothetical protein